MMEPLVKLTVPLPDILEEVGGEYRVKGHRITLFDLVTASNDEGLGIEAMETHFPTLSQPEIEAVFEFCRANPNAVETFCLDYQTILDGQRATGKQLDTEGLRRRYQKLNLEKNGTHHPTLTTHISS